MERFFYDLFRNFFRLEIGLSNNPDGSGNLFCPFGNL
jgi:hypothetical protein